jgi:hypothetical protein
MMPGLIDAVRVCCPYVQVVDVLTHLDATSGAVSKALRVSASIPTDYFCMVGFAAAWVHTAPQG